MNNHTARIAALEIAVEDLRAGVRAALGAPDPRPPIPTRNPVGPDTVTPYGHFRQRTEPIGRRTTGMVYDLNWEHAMAVALIDSAAARAAVDGARQNRAGVLHAITRWVVELPAVSVDQHREVTRALSGLFLAGVDANLDLSTTGGAVAWRDRAAAMLALSKPDSYPGAWLLWFSLARLTKDDEALVDGAPRMPSNDDPTGPPSCPLAMALYARTVANWYAVAQVAEAYYGRTIVKVSESAARAVTAAVDTPGVSEAARWVEACNNWGPPARHPFGLGAYNAEPL